MNDSEALLQPTEAPAFRQSRKFILSGRPAGQPKGGGAVASGGVKPGDVYMLTNKPGGVLYIGVTDDLAKRVEQHRSRAVPGFARDYNGHSLVWFERFDDIQDARLLERRMKKWNRAWKLARIVERNPEWRDLVDTLNQ